MEHDGFEAWLASIGNLTNSQHSRGYLMFALAEVSGDESSQLCVAATTMASPDPIFPVRTPDDGAVTSCAAPDVASITEAARQRVERAGCPHCASHSLQRWGHVSGLPRYRCKDCRRSFNALNGTPLARLRKKERWAVQVEALTTGGSMAAAAKRCCVAVSTAFRWRHRFLSAPAADKPGQLRGIVEAYETYIREPFKSLPLRRRGVKRSGLPRPARKRGGWASKRDLSAEQIAVLAARDRSGRTTCAILALHDRASVTAALGGVGTTTNQLCCNGGKSIVGFDRRTAIPCCILPKPGGPIPGAPALHINNIKAYHGRLKE